MNVAPQEFLSAVFHTLPEQARPWVAGFRVDPYHPKAQWGGMPVKGHIPDFIEPDANLYFAVSSFKPHTGLIKRRKANFAGLHVVMIDDVGTTGTGTGVKVSDDRILLPPSYRLNTSIENCQVGYILETPERDITRATAVIESLVAQGLATDGKDPGMKGVTRYGRLPGGINNKPTVVDAWGSPYPVELLEWNPDRRYTLDAIIGAYGLVLPGGKDHAPPPYESAPFDDSDPLLAFLRDRRMVKGAPNDSGWVDITCPWIEEHSDRADTGASYNPPHGFKCHHGHCESRTIHDVRAWAKARGWGNPIIIDPDLAAECGIGGREPGMDDEPARQHESKPVNKPDVDGFIPMSAFIARPPANAYRVKGILPGRGLAQVFGNSHSGKTFLQIDLACHIALGWDWNGHRVKQGAVVYIAAEGIDGLVLRFKAWFLAHNVNPPDNLFVRTVPADLTIPGMGEALRECMQQLPTPPDVVFIDTFATNFGPGSENCDEDMKRAIAGMQAIQGRGLVVSTHHTGHGDKSRGRGHSSLYAALDLEIQVDRDANDIITVKHTKFRDGTRLDPIGAFTLTGVNLPWADEDGEPLNSAVLTATDIPIPEPVLTRAQRIALDALKQECARHTDGWAFIEDWRKVALDLGISTSDKRAARSLAFTRAMEGLLDMGLLAKDGEKYRLK